MNDHAHHPDTDRALADVEALARAERATADAHLEARAHAASLDRLAERFEELNALLADAGVIADQQQFRRLSREHAELEPVVSGDQAARPVAGHNSPQR